MTRSLNTALPSIHRTSKQPITKHHPLQFKVSKSHGRTTSAPTFLPNSHQSLNVLCDAIDLDQQMRQFFKAEVLKSKNRTNHFVPALMARRRSKSAPGAPPSYHYQRAFNSRWFAPDYNNKTVTSASAAQEVAQLIVQKHIESVKKRE